MSYLKRLPLDGLKIDQSFISDLGDYGNDCPITRAIIVLAHELGLTVVAEGVSNRETLHRLRRLNCDEAQGNYIGRPLSAREFTAFMESWESKTRKPEKLEAALS